MSEQKAKAPEEGKTVSLQIRRDLLEKIVSGEKDADYRSLSRYNINLLTRAISDKYWEPRNDIAFVKYNTGFGDDRRYALCEISKIDVVEYRHKVPAGMKPGTVALTIRIRRVVEHNL